MWQKRLKTQGQWYFFIKIDTFLRKTSENLTLLHQKTEHENFFWFSKIRLIKTTMVQSSISQKNLLVPLQLFFFWSKRYHDFIIDMSAFKIRCFGFDQNSFRELRSSQTLPIECFGTKKGEFPKIASRPRPFCQLFLSKFYHWHVSFQDQVFWIWSK